MRHGGRILAAAAALGLALQAAAGPAPRATRYLVTFETTACGGGMGLASVDAAWIERIVEAGCAGPGGEPLMQVLVRAPGQQHYSAHVVTAAEARRIMDQVQAWSEARRRVLERGSGIVLDRP